MNRKIQGLKLSRSKIELYLDCPRCFFLDQKLGVKRPSIPAFTLNSAVDHLLKKEFDIHRAGRQAHPLMTQYGISAIPFRHPELEKWRHNFTGIQYKHPPSGFLIFGAIDDVWINNKEELHIVDYKATSKNDKPNLEGRWQQAYKRQMEIYQWLFRKNGFKVSDLGYFVYVNGRRDEKAFDGRLEFDIDIIAYKGNDGWLEKTILQIAELLKEDKLAEASQDCEYCLYRQNSALAIKKLYEKEKSVEKKTTREPETESRTLF